MSLPFSSLFHGFVFFEEIVPTDRETLTRTIEQMGFKILGDRITTRFYRTAIKILQAAKKEVKSKPTLLDLQPD